MRFPKLPLSLLAAVSMLPACVADTGSEPTDVDQVTADLERDNGNFDTTDEAPSFGLDTLYAEAAIEADANVTDEFSADTDIVAMDAAVGVEAHDLAVIWGQLPADPASDARDWSGTLTLSRGAMLVRRRIGFELATDRVLPRTRRDVVEIRSMTRPFADGLVLRVYDPTPGDAAPLTLTYRSTDGSREYALELRRLADGPIVVDAGEGDHVVAVGRRRDDACSHGVMRGRWRALSPHAGVFLGVVANAAGEPIGHVRGIYGERRNGDSVVFGKFIARDGRFTGILNGHYDNGRFEARWLDRAGDHGVLRGAFFESDALRRGGFLARWAETSCDARP